MPELNTSLFVVPAIFSEDGRSGVKVRGDRLVVLKISSGIPRRGASSAKYSIASSTFDRRKLSPRLTAAGQPVARVRRGATSANLAVPKRKGDAT